MPEAVCPSCGKKFPHGTTTCNWCTPADAVGDALPADVGDSASNGNCPEVAVLHFQPSNSDGAPIPLEANPLSTFVVRAFLGAIVWIAVLFLGILSQIGSHTELGPFSVFGLLRLLTVALPIWAIAGFFKKKL